MLTSMPKFAFTASLAALLLILAAPVPGMAHDNERDWGRGHSERDTDWRDRHGDRRDRMHHRRVDRRDWDDRYYGKRTHRRADWCDDRNPHNRRGNVWKKGSRKLHRIWHERCHGREAERWSRGRDSRAEWWRGRWQRHWDRWDSRAAERRRQHPHGHLWHPHRY
jgi:hypothetical protein